MRLSVDHRRVSVHPLTEGELTRARFSQGVFSIGYEERSRFISEELGSQTESLIGVDLGDVGVESESYQINRGVAERRAKLILARDKIKLQDTPDLSRVGLIERDARIFVDTSSMDRRTMSLVIYHLLSAIGSNAGTLYMLYAPAKYISPSPHQLPVESQGPVNALLSGVPKDPHAPTVLFLGLGYEVGLALGVVETFEPARVWALVPRGRDVRFDARVDKVNAPLFDNQPYIQKIHYGVQSPAGAFISIKDKILAIKDKAKIIVVPLGPKILSSISILLGYFYAPDLTIWRVSTQIDRRNANRKPDQTVVGFKVEIRATERALSL